MQLGKRKVNVLARSAEAAKNLGLSLVSKEVRDQQMVDRFDDKYASIEGKIKKLGCKLNKYHSVILETGGKWKPDQSHHETKLVLSVPFRNYSEVVELLKKAKIRILERDFESPVWHHGMPDNAKFTILIIKGKPQQY